ncbi:hypothetical protein DPEC_G00112340 [Dallia pectoralis]|uniref:Uncharacterized protein n=1 Tax=Dallia pectoralis TaxID=75939 RepID=A0ACC2GTG7_DALPE|nr:hypothetical protein DPEC_G00112340 [Dallia pectoralis]
MHTRLSLRPLPASIQVLPVRQPKGFLVLPSLQGCPAAVHWPLTPGYGSGAPDYGLIAPVEASQTKAPHYSQLGQPTPSPVRV